MREREANRGGERDMAHDWVRAREAISTEGRGQRGPRAIETHELWTQTTTPRERGREC